MEPIIAKEFIELGLQHDNKEDVIDHLAQLLVKEERINNLETYVDSVMKREAITSTAIGFDVAIPHGKSEAVVTPTIVFGRSDEGIVWNEEGDVVKLVFLLAIPSQDTTNQHLRILAMLSRKLLDEGFIRALKEGHSDQAILGSLESIFSTI